MSTKNIIQVDCGECNIQSLGRISIKKYMKRHGLKDGDTVKVILEVKESEK